MKAVVVQMSLKMIQECDELVKAKYYPNRNKLIRIAMRDLLSNRKEFQSSSRIVHMRMNDFACPECGAYTDQGGQEKLEATATIVETATRGVLQMQASKRRSS